MRFILSLVVIAACTQAETIPDNVCGNGVLEAGEDCDAPGDPACTATCRIVCSVATRTTCTGAPDGTCCPGDSTCGVDGVCHTPSGQIAAEFTEPYDVSSEIVVDIDGDHIADAMGVNNVEIAVRYGDPQTPFTRELTEPSPVVTGGVSFGDMTGDGRPDVVIPTTAGMFAWETSTGEPEPIPFPARVDANATHLRIATTPTAVITLDLDATTGVVELGSGTRDFATTNSAFKPCNSNVTLATTIRGHEIHPYLDGTTRTLVPISIGSSICIATLGSTVGSLMGSGNTTAFVDAKADANGESFLSDFGSGGCPSLVAALTTGTKDTAIIVAGSGAEGACTVPDSNSATAVLPGSPFAAIQLATAGTPWALVTSSGIVDPGSGTILAPATRTWTYALVTDLDGDGLDDIVVADSGTDIEVLYQRATTGTTPQLLDVVIPTIDTVEYMATGDFDGDGNGDVAFGTIDATMTGGPADLQIAWGSPSGGGFVETDVGNLVEPHDLVATNLVDVSLPNGYDQFDDLIVAKGGDTGDPALLVAEYGSSTRDLTAPFVFTSRFGAATSTQPIRATGTSAQIGDFGSDGGSGVYAVFGTTNASVPYDFTAVSLTETSFGDFTASEDVPFSSCGPAITGSGSDIDVPFCVTSSHFTRWARTAPVPDMILASRSDVDGGALTECLAYATATNLALTPISCADLATVTPGDPNTTEELASLTDVANARLFVGPLATRYFLAKQPTDAEYAVSWELTASASDAPQLANPVDFNSELTPLVAAATTGATAHCMDAVAVDLGTRTVDGAIYGANVDELVLACVVGVVGTKAGSAGAPTTQLWARYEDADPTQPPSYTQLVDLGIDEVIHLRDGDVNGDGLTDILYTLGTAGAGKVEIHTFLQCDTHTTGCMGGE